MNWTRSHSEKKTFLDDHLARCQFQKKVHLWVDAHINSHQVLLAWAMEKKAYLEMREAIHSVPEATLQLSLLQAFEQDLMDKQIGAVGALSKLGQEICEAKFETSHSSWEYEHPDQIRNRQSEVDAWWLQLRALADTKRLILEDHLAREEYAVHTRLLAGQHRNQTKHLEAWFTPSYEFLTKHCLEHVHTVDDALARLGQYEAYLQEKDGITTSNVASLKQLGHNILSRKFATSYSSYMYENPTEISANEKHIDELWSKLEDAAISAKTVLDDNLSRNQFQNKVRLWVKTHADLQTELAEWYLDRKTYLENKQVIASIQQAELQLSVLSAFRQEKMDVTEGSVASLKQLGEQIRSAEYSTALSHWRYEAPQDVKELEEQIEDTLWPELDKLASTKQVLLEDDLAREQFKEEIRLQVQNHASSYELLEAWCREKLVYLSSKEVVHSSEDAKGHLSLLHAFEEKKAGMLETSVRSLRALGASICKAKYTTSLSTWVYEHPEQVQGLEEQIGLRWAEMREKSEQKRLVLEDDRARELYAEETRLVSSQHADQAAELHKWLDAKVVYLSQREPVLSTQDAQFHLSLADAFQREKAAMTATSLASLHQLRETIFNRKYQSAFSTHVFEALDDVTAREEALQAPWDELDQQLGAKLEYLKDWLACNMFKDKTELSASLHRNLTEKIQQWCQEKLEFLQKRPEIMTVEESRLEINLLDGYLGDQEDKMAGMVVPLKARGAAIRAASYSGVFATWCYPTPEVILELEGAIGTCWLKLTEAASSKRSFLEDCLLRTQEIARVHRLIDRHLNLQQRIKAWAVAKQQDLQPQQPPVDGLADVAVKLRLLEALEAECSNTQSTTVASLRLLGESICKAAYTSSLSTWTFTEAEMIERREQDVSRIMDELSASTARKREELLSAQDTEQTKEDFRQEFAHAAHAMRGFVKDNIIFVRGSLEEGTTKATSFAFSLQETSQLRSELEANSQALLSQAEEHKVECMNLYQKLAAYGPVSNPYTTIADADLAQLIADLEAAIRFRSDQYEKALELQQSNDAWCRQFADLVNPIMSGLRQSMDRMTRPEGQLSDQLNSIDAELCRVGTEKTKFQRVAALEAEMKVKGIEYNPHCSVTSQDLLSQFEDYTKLLEYKKPLLEHEIEFKRSRGVTRAQLEEIETFFQKFDQDGSGAIEKRELKACLFSLGEELTSAEVDHHIHTFGSGGKLNLQQFKDLMIHLIGVIQTREHILASFSMIARDPERINLDKLKRLSQEHLDFVQRTICPVDNTIDYQQFTDIVLSR
eukprot:m.182433 g.182433  ORF g.182433 m.182433 type:complete len:1285 (+) comp16641_c0_seq1:297-4151(+)